MLTVGMAFEQEPTNWLSVRTNKSSRQIVQNVLKVCQEEKAAGETLLPLSEAHERAALLTGCSSRTIRRIKKGYASDKSERKVRCDKVDIDDFDKCVLRRLVNDMYARQKLIPTVKNIHGLFKAEVGFNGSMKCMRRILKEMGFSWRRITSNRKQLMERPDVVAARIHYLRKIQQLREDGWHIVYTDETYVHSSHSAPMCWQSDDSTFSVPFGKGERYIIVHAGSADGFIQGAELIFKAKTSTGDYHDEMNSTNFHKWLQEKLIPNLPPKSALVLDNAAYHNIQHDKLPVQSNRKAEIQGWLQRHGIDYQENMLKAELLQLCKQNNPGPKYVIHDMLEQHGHTSVRLPQYHADLNAIELIWSQVKGEVGRLNSTFKMKDVLSHIIHSLATITAANWRACCEHVQKIEKSYWKLDIAMEDTVERLVIKVTSSDEDTDTATSDSSSETDTATEVI